MKKFSNGLTPAEAERLALLVEECAEVQQIAMKILRHGYESYNPTIPNSPTNRDDIQKEIGHLQFAIELMVDKDDIIQSHCIISKDNKQETIQKWLHHNKL